MPKKIVRGLIYICLFFGVISLAFAQQDESSPELSAPGKLIKVVEVTGNKAISAPTIMAKIKTRIGQPYYPQAARDDIKRLYETGFFADISLHVDDFQDGLKVIFEVEERPVIDEIRFEGNRTISRGVLLQKVKSKVGQYLNLSILKEDLAGLKKEYEKRGLPDVQIEEATDTNPETNKAKVTFKINEGKKVKIRRIFVDNNLRYSDGRILSLIKTRRARIFNAGIFKEDQFQDDLERIKAFYLKNGYLDIKVDYRIDYDLKGQIHIRLLLDEGKQYKVGSVSLAGNEQFSDQEVRQSLKACLEGGVFSYEALKEDVANIQGFYFGKGYIFVRIQETASLDATTGKVEVTYQITENEVAYVERIEVQGNLKTRDKVVRREMRIKPGERFDGDKLKRSKERLYNLGFFEEVNYDTSPGSEPNQRNLIVEVREAKTGSVSFGGGYSSIDQFVGFVELEQRNFDWKNWKTFTGAGQDLKVRAEMGSVRQTYSLSFTEPWLFDRPISFGFDLYKTEHQKESDVGYGYGETRVGGDLRLSKEFNEYLKGGVTLRVEEVTIEDVDVSASQDLKDEEGKNQIRSLEFSLTRDTTDNVFNPSRGYVLSGSSEFAGGGLGGDKDFTKMFGLATLYVPGFGKGVLQLQGRVGFAQPFGNQEKVPIYERFYAGGANTIRGYEERSVGPVDSVTGDPLGGEALLIFNVEYAFPLLEFIKGAVFFDTGNVWSEVSSFGTEGLSSGIGFGVRIKTPIGPLKLDYGIPLDQQPGDEDREREGRFHFSMSHGF
ncbi:MAG: outer membrane protein assembly factor BamA [Candidatus Omnitrophota bacterium]